MAFLERLCEKLEPSLTQLERAKTSYEAVGQWLADADSGWLASSRIYLQGSTALGTTVNPIGRNEYDVDLICLIPQLGSRFLPASCKQLIGDRLKQHERYKGMLEEKPRCWRLNYADEFHMDVTSSIPNANCANGGELVPDKALQWWKPTNPKGYRSAFQKRAELVPRMRMKKLAEDRARADADIEPFPQPRRFKGLLCRVVQIAKRHRDVYFLTRSANLAPISVIITTLAAWSYEHCVRTFEYDSELDVLYDVIKHMPDFIEYRHQGSQIFFFIWNETTQGENFAERWNTDPERARAFFEWHKAALADLDQIAKIEGLDRLKNSLAKAFGQAPTADVLNDLFANVSNARRSGNLAFAPQVGLTVAAAASATPVRANTFFGAP